ncbi:thioesterase II family protein [Streptomyces sp. NPDC050529]|uniref:thioesterase II family protein n=1 Tax=unclassified Streptomyces TaxID=2593676 RepID=UPI002DDB42BD|nr:alpha/beta fold hydrolase [Streptomyces sp. NBC_01022]WRZ84570.1 thioesterase domain-containing protein [Streptomyces sp. NBC_01022]
MTRDPVATARRSWWAVLRRPESAPAAPRRRLVVLPHSAAGPTALDDVLGPVPDDVEILGLALPGRERRFNEPPGCTLDDVLDSAREELLDPDVETVLFGHSLGALLAFHVAGVLGDSCKALVIGGQVPGGCRMVLDARTPQEMYEVLLAGGGTTAEVLENPYLLKAVTRILAADVALGKEASDRGARCLDVPLFVLAALDDPLAPSDRMSQWAAWTSASCEMVALEGQHFALLAPENRTAVADVLAQALRCAGAGPGRP